MPHSKCLRKCLNDCEKGCALYAQPEALFCRTYANDSCYRALAAKDSRFDGVFFVGVSTTEIYCRPICSAKTPRPSSRTFYTGAAAAEAAGFRPCLRCRPELAPYALQQNLAYAFCINILGHPIELAQTQRLLFVKKLLQETRLSMAALADAAGFGSVRGWIRARICSNSGNWRLKLHPA